MTTFIKTKFKISDDQTNIDKYRSAANITLYHIISKLILQRIIVRNFCGPINKKDLSYGRTEGLTLNIQGRLYIYTYYISLLVRMSNSNALGFI